MFTFLANPFGWPLDDLQTAVELKLLVTSSPVPAFFSPVPTFFQAGLRFCVGITVSMLLQAFSIVSNIMPRQNPNHAASDDCTEDSEGRRQCQIPSFQDCVGFVLEISPLCRVVALRSSRGSTSEQNFLQFIVPHK